MGDSDDDLFSFATTNELPEYPFQFENSNFGPERSSPKCRQTIIPGNAARERTRVKTLRGAFLELQRTLPAVPPDTKLSKLDVLVLATTYIAHLMRTLNEGVDDNQLFAAHGIMHPVKKWPMRSRLYAGILSSAYPLIPKGKTPECDRQNQIQCLPNENQQSTSAYWNQSNHVTSYQNVCNDYL